MPCRWAALVALAVFPGCGGEAPREPELPLPVDVVRLPPTDPGHEAGTEPNLHLVPEMPSVWERTRDWLTRHQGTDGAWSAAGSGCACGDTAGEPRRVGATALALLAYYSAGYDLRDRKHGRPVRRGLEYLLGAQDREGAFGSREAPSWLLDQALASLAVANAWGVSESEFLAAGARKGIDLLAAGRRRDGGWGSGPGEAGDPDPTTTAWATMALHVGVSLDLVPAADIRPPMGGALDRWTGEWMAGERHPDVTAAVLLFLRAHGWDGTEAADPSIPVLQESLVVARPERTAPGTTVDPAWLFFADLGLRISSVKIPHDHARCGPCWKWGPRDSPRSRWWQGARRILEERVRVEGCADGSADPVGTGPLGLGRVGATALLAMTEAATY